MHLRDDMGRLAAAHRAGQHLAMLFNYDGALAPPVTHAALARCPDSTARILAQLAELPRVGVGVLSNRTMDDLKSMVRLPKLSYVATSGLEVDTKGVVVVHPRAHHYRPYLDHAVKTLAAVIAPFDGAWLEDKVLALTVHHSAVSCDDESLLQQCLSNAMLRYEGLLTASTGSGATNILPDRGWAKGDTVRQIVESLGAASLAFYAGSDASDDQALRITKDAGGVAIGIGSSAPASAMHQLPDAERLASELATFLGLVSDPARDLAKAH